MIKTAKQRRGSEEANDLLSGKVLHFDPTINIHLPDSERPLQVNKVYLGEPLIESELGGTTFYANADELELLATLIRFEGGFYHTTHGRKKLKMLCRKIHGLSSLRYNPLYCRVLGATIDEVSDKASDLWIITDMHGGVTLEWLLGCSGTFSLKRSLQYLESLFQALADLHTCNIAHQGIGYYYTLVLIL